MGAGGADHQPTNSARKRARWEGGIEGGGCRGKSGEVGRVNCGFGFWVAMAIDYRVLELFKYARAGERSIIGLVVDASLDSHQDNGI